MVLVEHSYHYLANSVVLIEHSYKLSMKMLIEHTSYQNAPSRRDRAHDPI